jgi:hypothetical protein
MRPLHARFSAGLRVFFLTCGLFLGSMVPAVAQPLPAGTMVFEFPLWVDGRNVGDITASVKDDKVQDVQRDRLLTLLAPLIKPEVLAPLRSNKAMTVTAQELSAAGLPLRYLPDAVRLDLQTKLDIRRPQDINLGYFQDDMDRDFVQPSDFSAIVNSSVRSEYAHTQPSGEDDTFNPLNAVFNLRANALGVSGVNPVS